MEVRKTLRQAVSDTKWQPDGSKATEKMAPYYDNKDNVQRRSYIVIQLINHSIEIWKNIVEGKLRR